MPPINKVENLNEITNKVVLSDLQGGFLLSASLSLGSIYTPMKNT